MVARFLLFSIIIRVTGGGVAIGTVDGELHGGVLKCRTLLRQVVAQESESIALGKDHRLFVQRTVLKMKNHFTGHSVSASSLGQLTCCDGLALRRAQKQKAMNKTLPVEHRKWRCRSLLRCSQHRRT